MSVMDDKIQILDDTTEAVDVPRKNRTLPLLTKYEKARIIGIRATQLSNGAIPRIPIESDDVLEIAESEFMAKTIPFIVRRYLPDGTYEDWKLRDMTIPDLDSLYK
ncbi:RNA polymerase subunit K [Pseudoloma neurophilia]|uniref:RNA polymerase subunit K n=1 Tax=Pseudoloma neurophilia TaxID=146866 RepID=A0A0R0M6P6_9MICR|nr:RNA polymerase subunit K [Pseudoloma neurophilia]